MYILGVFHSIIPKTHETTTLMIATAFHHWIHSGQSAKWDSVGCVSMWWLMYIEGYIFVFWYTEEIGLLYMFPLNPSSPSISLFSKNSSDAAGGCSQYFCFFFCNTFFLCFKEKSISVCITVLYYILILIVHFSKSMYKPFAKKNISLAHFSKSSSFPSSSNLFQTISLLLRRQPNKTTASEKQLAQFWV